MVLSQQKQARNRDNTLHLSNEGFFKVNSTVDNTTHITHNLDGKHPTRPGFEPSTWEFRAKAGPNEPSGRSFFLL